MSRLLPRDLLRLATVGLRTRKLRAALSVLGISIGIASLVAVLAISETSKADLLAKIETTGNEPAHGRPRRIALRRRNEAAGRCRRSHPPARTRSNRPPRSPRSTAPRCAAAPTCRPRSPAGSSSRPPTRSCCATLEGTTASGRFVDRATERYPAIVLGAKAAKRLGHPQRRRRRPGLRLGSPLHRGRHPRSAAAGPRTRQRRADRLPGGGAPLRHRPQPVAGLRPRPRGRSAGARRRGAAAERRRPLGPRRSRGQPPLRRARGAGRRRRRLHLALPRARRGRPPGRRRSGSPT